MKQKSGFLLICFLLFMPLNLKAYFCDEWGDLAVEGEWLYLRPTKENYLFSSTSGIGPVFDKPETVIPSYHSGWRVGVNYYLCNCLDHFSVRGTRLKTTDRQTFASNSFIIPFGTISSAAGIVGSDRVHFDYYAIEFLFSHKLCYDCRFNIEVVGGVQYARIGRKETVLFQSTTPFSLKHQAHFWGVGPELGMDFYYCLYSGFSLSGRGLGSLLASRAKQDFYRAGATLASQHQITNQPVWTIVPAIDLRFGLRYDRSWSCLNICLEAGYELISYVHGLPVQDITTTISTSNEYDNANMHGPYIAFGIIF